MFGIEKVSVSVPKKFGILKKVSRKSHVWTHIISFHVTHDTDTGVHIHLSLNTDCLLQRKPSHVLLVNLFPNHDETWHGGFCVAWLEPRSKDPGQSQSC